jgi:hypothetical protein
LIRPRRFAVLTVEFEDKEAQTITDISNRLKVTPKDAIKASLLLLLSVYEAVAKGKRTVVFRDGSFGPYKEVVISPNNEDSPTPDFSLELG